MALNDAAVLSISTGHYYHAPVGTEAPAITDLLDPEALELAGWDEIGHTSLEDILSLASEGGEATTLGTLQAKSLRNSISPRTETFSISLMQFDTPSLKFYYGSNATVLASGFVGVPSNPVPTKTAFLAVFQDGENVFGIHALSSEIFRGDDMEFADTESLVGMPLNVTPVNYQGADYAYAVTPLGDVTP